MSGTALGLSAAASLAGLLVLAVGVYGWAQRRPYAWYLVKSLLTVAFWVDLGFAIYRICGFDYPSRYSRGEITAEIFPVLCAAWVLFRVLPGQRKKFFPSDGPKADSVKTQAPEVATEETPDDPFVMIGACTPLQANELLGCFEKATVRFQIEGDTRSGRPPGSRPRVNSVKIFIHEDDRARAAAILAGMGKAIGSL